MRRVVLLALLALALPTVALATTTDTDFGFGGIIGSTASTSGTPSATNTFSISSQLETLNHVAATGTVVVTTGTLVGDCTTGCTFTGGTLDVDGATDFNGTFSGTLTDSNGVIEIHANPGGNPVVAGFNFVVASDGQVSGDFTVTPEPGTLGLLGTGLVGLAGMVRRKLRG